MNGHDFARRPARLDAVRATDLLDAEAEASFDRLTALARRLTGAPLAFLTVVDDWRSYWLSREGLPAGSPVQNTVEESFSQYVVGGDPLILPDVTLDDRTKENPSIEGMGVRSAPDRPALHAVRLGSRRRTQARLGLCDRGGVRRRGSVGAPPPAVTSRGAEVTSRAGE
ncbi:hypothetical protein [Blastococcus saxobsidens]|uniref:GAF domain-containing protein n=1 Tax=Blastococcus saxobsidens TaxID=138336 RepID=A0A4V2G286_9ACTN|nr:hypothetical protein [Blastococcus saxobsidens]RZU32176.1 hypothetical protein BKA19_1870 [Blastococcus saxobsidens]